MMILLGLCLRLRMIINNYSKWTLSQYEVTDQGCQADLEHGILNKERYSQGKEQSSCAENDEVNQGEFAFTGLTWRVQCTARLLEIKFV